MIDLQTSNEIIKGRALGFSYDDIADFSGVSKPVVMKICQERKADIEDSRKYATSQAASEIKEAVVNRKIIYNTLLYKASSELMRRDLSVMNTKELTALIGSLERSLSVLEGNNLTKTSTKFEPVDEETLAKMAWVTIKDDWEKTIPQDLREEIETKLKAECGIAN